jgi:simple sugar transport system permease protein
MLALLAGAVLIAAVGQSPLEVYGMLAQQALGTGYGVGQTLFKATPLLFAGLSVALAFRAGLFNVGAEGQMYLGGFAAGVVGAYVPLPSPLLLPLALLAAALAGALWAAIAGVLKARFGAHEVINTIMLNFIAFALVAWWGQSLFMTATVRTREVAEAATIARLETVLPWLRGSPANFSLVLGLFPRRRSRRAPVPHARGLRAARAGTEPGRRGVRGRQDRPRAGAGVRALRRARGPGRHELRARLQALVRAGFHRGRRVHGHRRGADRAQSSSWRVPCPRCSSVRWRTADSSSTSACRRTS